MAIVTRYFSTPTDVAGAGDGTTWADRAALFSSGNWSSVITGFNFAGSDSLLCLIGPGTYTCGQTLASGLFSNAPTTTNQLYLHGADSSGNALTPPQPGWTADQPAWSMTGIPVIETSTNIATSNQLGVFMRLLNLEASGRTSSGGVLAAGSLEWVMITNSTNDVDTSAIVGPEKIARVIVRMTGASYSFGIQLGTGNAGSKVRIEGNAGSSGDRNGVVLAATTQLSTCVDVLSVGNGGHGFASTSTNVNQRVMLVGCMAIDNGGDGFRFASTASQVQINQLTGCVATGNGGYGVNAQSAANVLVLDSRFRDNTSGNFNGLGNYPTSFDNYTTDADNSEYADHASGDYRIAHDAAIAGMGFGISQEPSPGGGGGGTIAW